MFFTVKHGGGQQDLFNSNCSLNLLIDSIVKRCHFPEKASIGLIDDRFHIINLTQQSDYLSSCSALFTERGMYTLIAIYRLESGHSKYEALLQNVEPELEMKLDSLTNPQAVENKFAQLKSKMKTKISTPTTRTRKPSASRSGRTKI